MGDSSGMELPPIAPMLMQSLRAVGYTAAAALADLVDNSIAARASNVAIRFGAVPEPVVIVVDDGEGMDEATLVAAMRFGSRDPRDKRSGNDLGRFGLGLKTASLSQCRRLTVASMNADTLSTARWDLDECERRGTWWLDRPDASKIPSIAIEMLRTQGRGTAVIWEVLDRLLEPSGGAGTTGLDHVMDEVVDHLAMVFHRFLSGEISGPFEITVNERPLPHLDPFLEGHSRGQSMHSESFRVEGCPVTVSPFVLPFPSRLHPEELGRAGGRESLKSGHGFYVYRGGRLVVPGGWFRIVPSDELVRLARVRVDVPVELDHLWKVDIRKTVAEPPRALRPDLRRIVGGVTLRSRRIYTHRSAADPSPDRVSVWNRHTLRDGAALWKINRDHPALHALTALGKLDAEVERLFRLIEECLPLHDIHVHISNDLPVADRAVLSDDDLEMLGRRLADTFKDEPEALTRLLDHLSVTDPFSRDPDKARQLAERLRQ